jgi:hypothetical protein
MEHGRALRKAWIVAEGLYPAPALEYFFSPVIGRNLGQANQCFKYWQPYGQIFIEHTFGI